MEGNAMNFLLGLIIFMVTFMLALGVAAFVLKRRSLISRLRRLRTRIGNYSRKFPINIRKIQDEISIAETDLAAKIL